MYVTARDSSIYGNVLCHLIIGTQYKLKLFTLYFLTVLASWRFDLICLSSVSSVSSVSKFLKLIAITALWLALCRPVAAAEFTFGALGDTPYTRFEEAHFPGLLAGMGQEDLAFAVHVGDFKAARARCSDETFLQRRNWFNAAPLPFVFVPGDNEWTDCGGVLAGGFGVSVHLGDGFVAFVVALVEVDRW